MKVLKRLLPALLLVLVMSSVAYASGGHNIEDWWTTGFRVLNFIIFIAIIWWAAGKKVAAVFVGRREGITTQLDDLGTRKKEAEQRMADVEQSIANIAQERDQILEDARVQGQTLKNGIIEEAHKSAERIKEQAIMTAANERQAALKDIRAEVAEMVVEAAQSVLKDKLSAEEHDKLINNYLEKVVLN